jgi:hypothetical protein
VPINEPGHPGTPEESHGGGRIWSEVSTNYGMIASWVQGSVVVVRTGNRQGNRVIVSDSVILHPEHIFIYF